MKSKKVLKIAAGVLIIYVAGIFIHFYPDMRDEKKLKDLEEKVFAIEHDASLTLQEKDELLREAYGIELGKTYNNGVYEYVYTEPGKVTIVNPTGNSNYEYYDSTYVENNSNNFYYDISDEVDPFTMTFPEDENELEQLYYSLLREEVIDLFQSIEIVDIEDNSRVTSYDSPKINISGRTKNNIDVQYLASNNDDVNLIITYNNFNGSISESDKILDKMTGYFKFDTYQIYDTIRLKNYAANALGYSAPDSYLLKAELDDRVWTSVIKYDREMGKLEIIVYKPMNF